jgi:glycosyltransferase involved in cell wall biosynthesis
MCCHLPLDGKLGGGKVYLETAASYKRLGHEVELYGYEEISGKKHNLSEGEKLISYPLKLKEFILKRQNDFDIIEYEYKFLPFDRRDFSNKVKMVARSTLLIHHLRDIKIPHFKTIRGFASKILKQGRIDKDMKKQISDATYCLSQADYINVPNPSDRDMLISFGLNKDSIIVSPYGITDKRINELKSNEDKKLCKKIAFIGTFDKRKGCVEFPLIVEKVCREFPNYTFKFIGTKGMFQTKEAVENHFNASLRSKVEVIPSFNPTDLGELLKDCKLGIFPSHLESFGFSLIELYAAGLPTPCYEVPGPDMLSPKELMVPRGDANKLSEIILKLLTNTNFYENMKDKSFNVVERFNWDEQSKKAIDFYLMGLENDK